MKGDAKMNYRIFTKKRKAKKNPVTPEAPSPELADLELSSENVQFVLGKSNDIVFAEQYINGKKELKATLVFVDGLINSKTVSDDILKPLLQQEQLSNARSGKELVDMILHGVVYYASRKKRNTLGELINDILSGSAALIFDGEKTALTFDIKGFDKRSISEPTGENVTKGSKDSFVETLRVNTTLVRRKIKTKNLIIEGSVVGKQSLTLVSIVYMDGITNQHIITEVKKRLDRIDIDGVITTGCIEEYIIDSPYTIFPQILYTERPDRFCIHILEGRVGLLIDGLPLAFIIPATINTFLQSPEDYAQNYIVSTSLRVLRYILIAITLLLPAFYISIVTFHLEMMPTELALSIAASKAGVPFPSFTEVLFMLISFEILLEAGLRLPRNIGQAVSIVGALVIGQAAVQAKLVSPAVVIIVAITGIAGFTMPSQDLSNALRFSRFVFSILASIMGLFGFTIGIILLLLHLCSMETYGVPYLSPFVANENWKIKDTIFRFPLFTLKKRPTDLKTTNQKRQK